ncbi:MAG: hypothetical protein JWP76_2505 [Dactylosporangium sp.]|nr:hypothetical protein [Dactylosporangium sp.]
MAVMAEQAPRMLDTVCHWWSWTMIATWSI